ncbi:hypothetical protein TNCT_589751 [Trichonephila clavata]|uniref:Uncharacterized protein n=1 Tax=Trichonephila clavata TaxID=2740835 RepID=A0A8X6FUN3_TRICU|nr:hypothetical protein TNCT_589751 [Trichonephila clavata]
MSRISNRFLVVWKAPWLRFAKQMGDRAKRELTWGATRPHRGWLGLLTPRSAWGATDRRVFALTRSDRFLFSLSRLFAEDGERFLRRLADSKRHL